MNCRSAFGCGRRFLFAPRGGAHAASPAAPVTIEIAPFFIDTAAPWKLAKQAERRAELATVLYESLEALRVIAVLLAPFMPDTSPRILKCLGDPSSPAPLSEAVAWGGLQPGSRTLKGEPLFPRVETA